MKLTNYLKKIPYYSLISKIARRRNIDVWLVGGFLRDVCLARKKDFFDFDFCVEKDVLKIVKDFSSRTSSKFIVLDEEQGSYRVIIKKSGKVYTYDFTLMRGSTIHEDLSLRDFSINTLALNLNERASALIDYFGAQADLKKKLMRVVREEVLPQDPLRILRGFSFMVNYDFRIEAKTQALMTKYKKLLKNVSGERINEELFKIFASTHSYRAIKRLSDLKIIDEFIPHVKEMRGVTQGSYHHLDVWNHSLEALREFELLYNRQLGKHKEILPYLSQELSQGRSRLQVMKLASLLHDIGKPIAKRKKGKRTIFYTHEKIGSDLVEEIALVLKLSLRVQEVLKKLIFWHLRPGYLADQEPPSQRAIYRFFHDTQEEGASVILVSLSDWRATRGPDTSPGKRRRHERVMLSLVDEYFAKLKEKPLKKLLDGYDVMKKFNLHPSPLIGKILKSISEEQALGKVKTKTDAYNAAKTIIKKNTKRPITHKEKEK